MQIFVHRHEQQLGPFTEAEIKAQLASGELLPEHHVWWEGQPGWLPVEQTILMSAPEPVSETEPSLEPETHVPPLRPKLEPKPIVPREPRAAQYRGRGGSSRRFARRSNLKWIIGISAVVVALIGIVVYFALDNGTSDLDLSTEIGTNTAPYKIFVPAAPSGDTAPSTNPPPANP